MSGRIRGSERAPRSQGFTCWQPHNSWLLSAKAASSNREMGLLEKRFNFRDILFACLIAMKPVMNAADFSIAADEE